jgi:hypothetical protein
MYNKLYLMILRSIKMNYKIHLRIIIHYYKINSSIKLYNKYIHIIHKSIIID